MVGDGYLDNIGVAGVSANGYGMYARSPHGTGLYAQAFEKHAVEAYGAGGGLDGAAIFAISTGSAGIGILSDTTSSDANLVVRNWGSGWLIRAFSGPLSIERFRVDNDGQVHARGYSTPGFDLAERIEPNETNIRPGDVVEIDPASGRFVRSSHPLSVLVAGVVSTDPGVILGSFVASEPDGPKLALAGRVPVNVSAENGAIQPGDLLVSSSTPGHAMKGSAYPEPGTVIGKAVGTLQSGKGTIIMLIWNR